MHTLTIFGFVILIGVVLNNAILIVYLTLSNVKYVRYEELEGQEAILESVSTKVRPIFMSAITRIFGMLPLVLAPRAGAEHYLERG